MCLEKRRVHGLWPVKVADFCRMIVRGSRPNFKMIQPSSQENEP